MDHASLLLFAQRGGNAGDPGGALAAIAMLCCWGTTIIASTAYVVFMYMSMYQALNAVSPRNRDMEPGMIFLMLIPLFGAVWYFFVVIRIASSFQKEFEDRRIKSDGGDFGQLMGILVIIPCVGAICQIIWLIKIRGYTAQLAGSPSRRSRRHDLDDDDDDYRPPRRSNGGDDRIQ